MLAKAYAGFPEWLPAMKRKEKQIIGLISQVYESYGYTPIETSAVEKVDYLIDADADVNKEVYGLHRLAGDSKDKFGLHFDQTLPFARYTANNYGSLQFPFKRYQIQKVWRGERPQTGRYREFYQADIDVIAEEQLPLFYESEIIEVIYQIFTQLDIGDFCIRINNRKLLEGLYAQKKIKAKQGIFLAIDKLNKIGKEEVVKLLIGEGLSEEQTQYCINLALEKFSLEQGAEFLDSLEDSCDELVLAKKQLKQIFKNLAHLDSDKFIFDLSVTRGLDYYTGSVYETEIIGLEKFGSVCSGGRYDNLAEKFTKKKLPGVGISIGLSRLLYLLFENGRLEALSPTPVQVYITLFEEEQRQQANQIAFDLRQKGLAVEVSHKAKKLTKQIPFAQKRGASFILIIEEDGTCQMKNLSTGVQSPLDEDKIKLFFEKRTIAF